MNLSVPRHLGGMEVPGASDWQGGMNIAYRTGPGFLDTSWRIQLNVTSHNQRARVENVIGIIKGEIEPDRCVLPGNHRDAWFYGALDPSAGTEAMLEIAQVMGKLVQTGEWQHGGYDLCMKAMKRSSHEGMANLKEALGRRII
ncbi:N-acetylated-alpha-linked acidic dipeptidase 2 [Plakobranchus ocellatus]|uniref:N-acetylated-alpha-linked acidic dipeptidase 2 n=1 Tax=Plakobranchus ocellatus TaxID=259542 RepID=A0AAV4DZ36_9GAST|nr:N-acetylated-alpha-linked acidic dipeptidase 2 [Plakobranchus ocellatus]